MSRQTNDRVEMLMSRLERVRPAGSGWVARCPAHEDKSASLSIRAGRKVGSVLINCFAGCCVPDILQALDLSMEDLFTNLERANMTEEEKAEAREKFMRVKWQAALKNLDQEALFLLMVAKTLAKGETLDTAAQRKLQRSVKTVGDARFALCPRDQYRPNLEPKK